MKIILEKTYGYDGTEQVISKSITLEVDPDDPIFGHLKMPGPDDKDPVIDMLEKLLDLIEKEK